VEREWYPDVGGALRLNMIGPEGPWTSLHDGNGTPLRIGFQVGTSTFSSGVLIPGINEAQQALPPGTYELRIHMEDGSQRIVPLRVEAGRVNDVTVDLDDL
jgi:hypothetical protein